MALEVSEPSEMPASSSSQTLYDKETKEPTKPSKSLESTRSMSFPRIRKASKAARVKYTLTETQKEMYAAEKLMNFRWIAKTVATTSPYVLQAQDMVPQEIVEELSLLGQFAETVYACNSAKPFENFLFAHLRELTRPGFPYDCYTALLDSTLVSSFHGTVARLPATIFHHRPTNRLILSISGTSTLQHAYYDVKTLKHRHPSRRGQTHEGFWRLYKGLRARAFDALKDALAKFPDVVELVVAGHSMGGVVSQLLMLDLLADHSVLPDPDIRLKICAFGSPRPGDAALAQYWKELVKTRRLAHGEDSFTEYFVKAFNDGVPALPPLAFGFRHFTQTPFYLTDDHLYRIPESEAECTLFDVQERATDPTYPKGGHNYYNGRPIERFFKRINWLEKAKPGVEGWEERYRKHAGRHERWNERGATV